MAYIDLKDIEIGQELDSSPVVVRVEKYVSMEKLEWLNSKSVAGFDIRIQLIFSNHWTWDVLKTIQNIKYIMLNPSYEIPLLSLEVLHVMKDLHGLEIGDYAKKTLSFKEIGTFTNLTVFVFREGLQSKSQYQFVNNQRSLSELAVKSLDLALMERNVHLKRLRVNGVMKNTQSIGQLFPNLEYLHIHNASLYNDFDFLNQLDFLKSLNIYNSNKLVTFPSVKNPLLMKSICVSNCPNLTNIKEVLHCSNLEYLELSGGLKDVHIDPKQLDAIHSLKLLQTVHIR